jgi:hypothetical protein
MADLDQFDALTRKIFMPGMVDGIFKSGALLAYLKANCLETIPGANTWQEDFINARMNGSWLNLRTGGDTFDVSRKKIENGLTWDLRGAQVSVSADLAQLNTILTGDGAYFDFVDDRMQNAALTMSEALAISIYKHGQAGRTEQINGLDEALSDGTTNGYEGVTFANYGTCVRANNNGALNSPMTGPAANTPAITYPILEQTYGSVTVGQQMPNIMTTTQLGLSFIKMAFQTQQRFQPSEDTKFGFTGVKFNGATIFADNYAPGTSNLTAAAPGALGEFNNVATGETLWFLNCKRETMKLWISSNDLMGFGWTGWKPAQDNLSVAGQYLFAGNLTVRQPRFSRYLFGILG